jgi:hypothetical protein
MPAEYVCYPYEGNLEVFVVGEDPTSGLENPGMEEEEAMGAFVESNPELASYIPMVSGLESE